MKKVLLLSAGLLSLTLATDLLACDYPARVQIPDGATASHDEMIAGQRDVKEYVAAMETYLECMVAEEKAQRSTMDSLSAEDEQLREDMLNKKYNAAVDEMETVAARFNAEVRAFKDRED